MGEAAHEEHPNTEEEQDWDNPREEIAQKICLDFPCKANIVSSQLIGQLRRDPNRQKLAWVAFDRLFQGSLDIAISDPDLFDQILVEIDLKLAVRNLFDLSGLKPEIVQEDDPPQGNENIPNVKTGLIVHFFHGVILSLLRGSIKYTLDSVCKKFFWGSATLKIL